MSFTRTTDVPLLRCYAEAVKQEASVAPIRNHTPECKPLGARKKTHTTIRREGDDIIAKLYDTDIVRWKPDGTIIINQGGHATDTTRKYLNALLPLFFTSHQGKTVIWRGLDEQAAQTHSSWREPKFKQFILYDHRDNIFTSEPNNVSLPHFINPEPCMVHVINRAGAKLVRARYAKFIRYMENIKKLMNGFPDSTLSVAYLSLTDKMEMAAGDSLEDHHYVMSMLVRESRWNRNPPNPLRKFESLMLQWHRDEMLTAVTLPYGVVKEDRFKYLF
jgi:hypothetical protein